MAIFETITEAAQFVWALPLGIGKLISLAAGGCGVCIAGKTFFGDNNKTQSKTK